MRILFVVPWYQTDKQPHSGTFFRDLAEALKAEEIEVIILYPLVAAAFMDFIRGDYSFPENREGDVPIIYSFVPNMIPHFGMFRRWLLTAKSMIDFKGIVKKMGKPDLLHAHSVYRAGYIARQLSRRYQIPYIISENYSVVARNKTGNVWSSTHFSKIYNEAEDVITVSSSLKEDLNRHYGIEEKEVKIIPNAVHVLFYNSFQPKRLDTPFKLHFTAFLRPIKRLDLLFEAIAILDDGGTAVDLRVAGDGNIRSELEHLAEHLGISNQVHFLGYQTREQIKQSIDECHAVISTSEYETFGVNLLEGLACGRPVIATDSGGPRDFIHTENGILVEEHSPCAVAEAIQRMIARYETYDHRRIQEETKEKFSTDRVVSELIKVYKGVLHG